MSALNSALDVPLAAIILLAVIMFAVIRRLLLARSRERIVEQPNSEYTAPVIRNRETTRRWQDIALDNIHEINRVEVVRLLGKVEAAGVESLRPDERVFLDNVARTSGPGQAAETRGKSMPLDADLRHRPA